MAAPTFKKSDLPFHVVKGRDIVAISLSDYRGRTRIDVRQYYQTEEDGVFSPTRQGVQIDPEKWGEFKRAMAAFEKANKSTLK